MGDFIKIDRKILNWEWWSDLNTFRLFIYMLIAAYWKDGNYKGHLIERGSFPSSIAKLSQETCLTENEIRTALKHLKSTGEITSKSHSKFTVFTIKNYDLYQADNKQECKQTTRNVAGTSHSINELLTSSILKEDKNKRTKEYNIPPISPSKGETKKFIPPTVDEVREYCIERNNGVDPQAFVNFYESKGWFVGKNKMKDWKAAVRTWESNRKNDSYGGRREKEVNTYESESSVRLW